MLRAATRHDIRYKLEIQKREEISCYIIEGGGKRTDRSRL